MLFGNLEIGTGHDAPRCTLSFFRQSVSLRESQLFLLQSKLVGHAMLTIGVEHYLFPPCRETSEVRPKFRTCENCNY